MAKLRETQSARILHRLRDHRSTIHRYNDRWRSFQNGMFCNQTSWVHSMQGLPLSLFSLSTTIVTEMITTESSFRTRSDLKDDTAWGGAGKMCSDDVQFLMYRACSNTTSISSSFKRISSLLNTDPEGIYFPSSWALSPCGVLPVRPDDLWSRRVWTTCQTAPLCSSVNGSHAPLSIANKCCNRLCIDCLNGSCCLAELWSVFGTGCSTSIPVTPFGLSACTLSHNFETLPYQQRMFIHQSVSSSTSILNFWSEALWQSDHSQTTTHCVTPRAHSFHRFLHFINYDRHRFVNKTLFYFVHWYSVKFRCSL